MGLAAIRRWGDPEGTCSKHGFTSTCVSCGRGALQYSVKEADTCNQQSTQCYFKGSGDTKCYGSLECPYRDTGGRRGGTAVLHTRPPAAPAPPDTHHAATTGTEAQ